MNPILTSVGSLLFVLSIYLLFFFSPSERSPRTSRTVLERCRLLRAEFAWGFMLTGPDIYIAIIVN